MHKSEFSGELWWCCGKTKQDALGCKFGKHIARNDFDDDETGEKLQIKVMNQKCGCCRDVGHKPDKCPKDPNLKTISGNNYEFLEEDHARIVKISDDKKFHSATTI